MRAIFGVVLTGGILVAVSLASAPPGTWGPEPWGPGGRDPGEVQRSDDVDNLVVRMMEFDKNKDGKLTKMEVTDERLERLFDRADTDKDGVVTKEELIALAAKEQISDRGGPPVAGGPRGGGPGGPRMGAPPRPGEILPRMVRQRLQLSEKQEKEIAELQKEVDSKLEQILTGEQRTKLKEMQDRGPGGFGPPPGREGRPGGDGPPPRPVDQPSRRGED
jgi:EF hand